MRVSLVATAAKFALLIALSGYGLVYAAAGFVGAEALGLAVLLWQSSRTKVFYFADYAASILKTAPPVAAACAAAWLLARYLPYGSDFLGQAIRLGVGGTAALALWLLLIWAMSAEPKAELKRLGASIIRRRPKAPE